MTRRILLGALLAIITAGPAAAAKKVALIPAPVVKGHADNGAVLTRALEEILRTEGFDLVPQARVSSALRSRRVVPKNVIPIGTLAAIRADTGADYVLYPRVLSVGTAVNSGHFTATILVNVVGKNPKSFLHTRQVGQEFSSDAAEAAEAVFGREAADQAADRLLQGFWAKAK